MNAIFITLTPLRQDLHHSSLTNPRFRIEYFFLTGTQSILIFPGFLQTEELSCYCIWNIDNDRKLTVVLVILLSKSSLFTEKTGIKE